MKTFIWMMRNYPVRMLLMFFFVLPIHMPFNAVRLVGLVFTLIGKGSTKVGELLENAMSFVQKKIAHYLQWFYKPLLEVERQAREKSLKAIWEADIGGRITREGGEPHDKA